MAIEIHTLYHLSISIGALLGLLLIYSWALNRAVPSLAWWGSGMVIVAVGTALLAARGTIPDWLSIVVANIVFLFGAAVMWNGARLFDGRRVSRVGLVIGPVIWLFACSIPPFYAAINLRAGLGSAMFAFFTLAGAYEFWSGRSEKLKSRWPAIGLIVIHGVLFLARIPLLLTSPLTEGLPGISNPWFALVHYENILFKIALAFVLLAMTKERLERRPYVLLEMAQRKREEEMAAT